MDKQIAKNEGAFVELLNQEMKELQESQKQIEEMATEIARIILSCPLNQGRNCDCCKFNDKDTISYDCQSYLVAEKLLEKYQPKTPENAVVLTREETEKVYKTLKQNEEFIFNLQETATVCKKEMAEAQEEAVKQLEEYVQQVRKETAEKFKALLEGTVPQGLLDKICKEITEGEV